MLPSNSHHLHSYSRTHSYYRINIAVRLVQYLFVMAPNKTPMDPELKGLLAEVSFPQIDHVTPEVVKMMREVTATPPSWLENQKARGITHTEIKIPSEDSTNFEIILSILQPASKAAKLRPCIYWIHGGGFHWGDRLHALEIPTDMILECDVICVSVEYRLAPEHTYSVALEDCYTGLKWTSEHKLELGISSKHLMIGGISAGGGLAAAVALLCRDRQGPVLYAQCLICPAVDLRLTSVSSHQFVYSSDFLPRRCFEDIVKGLGNTKKDGTGSIIPHPAEYEDLSGLPQTWLDVGSAEVLRDDTVAYASKLWASGVQTELHVWAGGFHGFDIFLPTAAVAQVARKTRVEWVKRVLLQ